MNNEKNKPCPEFRFFGAAYPDATCIDGLLWDLDSGSSPDILTSGGEHPCPFCDPQGAYESVAGFIDYTGQKEGQSDDEFEAHCDQSVKDGLNKLRVSHGFEPFIFQPLESNS